MLYIPYDLYMLYILYILYIPYDLYILYMLNILDIVPRLPTLMPIAYCLLYSLLVASHWIATGHCWNRCPGSKQSSWIGR